MIELQLKPTIYSYDTCRDFVEDLQVGADDLIVTNQYIFDPNFKDLGLTCHVLFQEKYGMGEPSDEMAEAIYKGLRNYFLAHPMQSAPQGATAQTASTVTTPDRTLPN